MFAVRECERLTSCFGLRDQSSLQTLLIFKGSILHQEKSVGWTCKYRMYNRFTDCITDVKAVEWMWAGLRDHSRLIEFVSLNSRLESNTEEEEGSKTEFDLAFVRAGLFERNLAQVLPEPVFSVSGLAPGGCLGRGFRGWVISILTCHEARVGYNPSYSGS